MDKPIPHPRATTGYRQYPLDLNDPRNAEPLVDVRDYDVAGQSYYNRPDNPPYNHVIPGSIPQLWLRKTVAEKLAAANKTLAAQGLELYVFDAWRPTSVQRYFHDEWVPAQLQKQNPELMGDALWAEVEKFWAAPATDPSSPSPHLTGGAVDLTLRRIGGGALNFGTPFDDLTEHAALCAFEHLEGDVRINRRLLFWTLADLGFAFHPNEWWHASYGDQLWAQQTAAPTAFYGAVSPT
jgi:D-alanyl-D-alanine dipeptidase